MAAETTQKTAGKGLEGVSAADSAVCSIDGLEGKLSYRGYDIHDLVKGTFEETVFLLWNDRLPTAAELEEFSNQLKAERAIDDTLIQMMKSFPKEAKPMDVLRTVVSGIPVVNSIDTDDQSEAALRKAAIQLTAKFSTIVAAWHRIRNGQEPVAPDTSLDHASNYLYMINGEKPGPIAAKAMDIALILHAEHGFNASTFSARVTAATLSDVYSAITSAIGTLKGPLHGGANEGVIDTLLEIGSLDKVEDWVKDALSRKVKIMGFGHRVYKTLDPRAVHLRELSESLGKEVGELKWYEMSVKMMETVKSEKGLDPNVDFFSASTYYTMGMPTDLFTPTFAVSRISGWTAHVLEQLSDNRLIRPRANYVGKKGLAYVEISER